MGGARGWRMDRIEVVVSWTSCETVVELEPLLLISSPTMASSGCRARVHVPMVWIVRGILASDFLVTA